MTPLVLAVADLLLGTRCAGCGGVALTVCPECRRDLRPVPGPVTPAVGRALPVAAVAAGAHSGTLRRVLIGWKESGVTSLTDLLGHLLAAAVVPHTGSGHPVVLVPVPTSAAGRAARGSDLVDDLALCAARLLRRTGVDVQVARALTHQRQTVDQVGLGAAERRVNLDGAFRLRSARRLVGRDVVVVDDILTTGSTLAEAFRVLSGAGHAPVGVSVVAARPRPAETTR